MDLKIKIDDPELNEALCRSSEETGKPIEEIAHDALAFMFTECGTLFSMMDHYKRMVALANEKIKS